MRSTMNIWWLWLSEDDLRVELRQLEEEGRDISRVRARFERMRKLGNEKLARAEAQLRAQALLDDAARLPMRKGYAFREPSDLPAIRKLREKGPRRYTKAIPDSRLKDRILGAWLGRCAGCLLGKPVEGIRSWNTEAFLKATGQWPLKTYMRFGLKGKHAKTCEEYISKAFLGGFLRGYDKLRHMPIDDDTNYTTAGLLVVQKHGANFTPADVAHFWLQNLPLEATCTAERLAYRNFAVNIGPPDSASFRNPYREWIGAQIRADAFGYLNAGNPERAAEFAWRDACISHVKNGIYGEMLMAAMIAAAPWCSSVEEVILAGLSEIPETSRLHADIRTAMQWRAEGASYDEACARIHKRWDENFGHDWCHTNSNAVICAVALLWGGGDFGTSICRAVMPGFDTDCNGATVGSILGMMLGVDAIPGEWTAKLGNTLKTSMAGYESVAIDKIAMDTFDLCRGIR